jgi:hypothetical protein
MGATLAAMAAVQPRDALEEMVGAQRIIEHDRYPFSPRTRGLKGIRAIIEAREGRGQDPRCA